MLCLKTVLEVNLVLVLATCCSILSAQGRVILGNEVLRNQSFGLLAGENVAILTNPSGLFPTDLQHIVDVLHSDSNINISVVLAPEHGFRGDHQAESGDPDSYIDLATGLLVHSVYRKNQSEILTVLHNTNTTMLLVDIQDAGTRLYTFIWTIFDVIKAISTEYSLLSSENDGMTTQIQQQQSLIKVIVLDRPNPIGGVAVEGPLLNVSCCSSRYGKATVTHRHGLTVGELVLLFDGLSFNNSLSQAGVCNTFLRYW